MKYLLVAASAALMFSLSVAAQGLDGKEFCREVDGPPGCGGIPEGKREHCVRFNGQTMYDDANTFFGNPPENKKYVLKKNGSIYIENEKGKFEKTAYVYMNGAMTYSGQAMVDVHVLDGKTFCRTIEDWKGTFGHPGRKRRHCVRFENGMVNDNLGNPPENRKYTFKNGFIFMLTENGGWEKTSYEYENSVMKYNGIEMNEMR